ncbi:MAG: cytochrome c [Deltaproteobacteria bacterium]|nr:cytochrome c [Deltaproteobacteria bacterium]
MRNIIWLVALIVSFAFAGTALADGAATFKAKCAACHGPKGEGMKGMAPAQKGNKFITEGKPEDIKKIILEGRAGAAKKYKEFPIDMPKSGLSDADAADVVKFLQGDLQK